MADISSLVTVTLVIRSKETKPGDGSVFDDIVSAQFGIQDVSGFMKNGVSFAIPLFIRAPPYPAAYIRFAQTIFPADLKEESPGEGIRRIGPV